MDISWWFYAIAIVIGLVVWKTWRWEGGMLAGYVFILLVQTVLIRRGTPAPYFQPQPFWSWREWNLQKNQILINVIMFIPVGVMAGWMWKWLGLWFATGLSVVIEISQLITRRGLCELDDVIHNSIGAAIGIAAAMIIRTIGVIDEDNRENS